MCQFFKQGVHLKKRKAQLRWQVFRNSEENQRKTMLNFLKTSMLLQSLWKRILPAFLLSALGAVDLAQAQKLPNDSQLAAGQCYSLPDSKNYLSALKSKPDSYSKTVQEIGPEKIKNLIDTDNENYYFCQVRCKNRSGDMGSVWITQSDSPSRFSQMEGFSCAGVTVENVQIVGSVYGLQPVVRDFAGYDSSFAEIHQWLKNENFILDTATYNQKFSEFRLIFNKVAAVYVMADSQALKEAALIMSKMVDGSAEGQLLLKSYVTKLAQNHWQFKIDFQNAESIVQNMLKLNGRFLEYSEK